MKQLIVVLLSNPDHFKHLTHGTYHEMDEILENEAACYDFSMNGGIYHFKNKTHIYKLVHNLSPIMFQHGQIGIEGTSLCSKAYGLVVAPAHFDNEVKIVVSNDRSLRNNSRHRLRNWFNIFE